MKESVKRSSIKEFVAQQPHMIDTPFPMREGDILGRIVVPVDLTLAEVERIYDFLQTLCKDYTASHNDQS